MLRGMTTAGGIGMRCSRTSIISEGEQQVTRKNDTLRSKLVRLKVDILREDGRLERSCEHGVGHPVGSQQKWEEWMGVHGCDGCCKEWEKEMK